MVYFMSGAPNIGPITDRIKKKIIKYQTFQLHRSMIQPIKLTQKRVQVPVGPWKLPIDLEAGIGISMNTMSKTKGKTGTAIKTGIGTGTGVGTETEKGTAAETGSGSTPTPLVGGPIRQPIDHAGTHTGPAPGPGPGPHTDTDTEMENVTTATGNVTTSMLTISEWTDKVEQILGKWQVAMKQKAKLHCIFAKRLRKYDAFCTLPMYALGTATSSIQLILSTSDQGISDEARSDLQITCVVCTSLMTLATMVSRYFNWSVTSDRHWQAGVAFQNLVNDIDAQLILPPDAREPVGKFVHRVFAQRATLLQTEPELPEAMIEIAYA